MAKRTSPANRRGAWETWGDTTWESLLIRPRPEDGGGEGGDEAANDPAAALADCAAVGAIDRDVTAAALAGEWVPPPGDWALLVVHRTGGWSTLVTISYADTLIDGRLGDFRGESLRTGAYDTAGVLVVRHRRHPGAQGGGPEDVVNFVTDGVRWDEPDPDDDPDDPVGEGDTLLEGAAFPPEQAAAWLAERTSVKDAHDTLLRDADAYVPGLCFVRDGRTGNSGRLDAGRGHEDFLKETHVARIDAVRFGVVTKTPPAEAAGRRLEAAIGRGDVPAVRRALAAGATTGVLPGSRHTGFWLTLRAMSEYGAPDRPALTEIAALLLDAGADPDARPRDAAGPVELLRTTDYVQARDRRKQGRRWVMDNRLDTLAMLDWLLDVGVDPNGLSHGQYAHGRRPLHAAANSNDPDWVRRLLARGGDATLTDNRGLTPAAALRAQLQMNADHTWGRNRVPLDRALAEHAEVLALLDAAAGRRD